MDYYSYQNHCNRNIQEIPQTLVTNSNVSDGSSNSHLYGNYPYQDITTSYRNADPRLNYTYYGPGPNSSSNQLVPTNQATYDLTHQQMYDLSLPKPSTDVSVKSDDELWIETWLSKIGKIQINLNSTVEIAADNTQKKVKPPVKNAIQIHTAKNSLKNCLHVIGNLKKMQEFLKENAGTMSSADWRKNTLEIGSIKNEFSKMFSQFENPETIIQLRKTVEKRRKKRDSQRRRRKQHSEYMLQIHEERRKAHKDIDQWLENMKEGVERAKMEENMKKDADCVLAEVTKKKSDARKSLSLISSLVKLRHVREQAAIQRGEKVSVEDSAAFAKVSDHLTKIWTDALQVYAKEEQGLRVMLEQNATEDTNAACAAKERKITQEWEMAFFGPTCIPSPIYWGLTAAEKDLETFIAIRKSWDTFLTKTNNENGSKIPIGWVAPNPYGHESWTKYLHVP